MKEVDNVASSGTVRRGARRAARRGRRAAGPRGMDLEGLVRAHAGSLTFLGLTLGIFVSRKFFVLPVAVAATLFQDVLARSVEKAVRR